EEAGKVKAERRSRGGGGSGAVYQPRRGTAQPVSGWGRGEPREVQDAGVARAPQPRPGSDISSQADGSAKPARFRAVSQPGGDADEQSDEGVPDSQLPPRGDHGGGAGAGRNGHARHPGVLLAG